MTEHEQTQWLDASIASLLLYYCMWISWGLNPHCCPFRESYEWVLGLISGMGGGCPPLAFPSWIIMALGVNPSFARSASTLPPLSQFLIWAQWGLAVHCPALLTHTHYQILLSGVNELWKKVGKSRPTVKSLPHVIYYWESVSRFTYMSVSASFPLRDPHYKLSGSLSDCLFCLVKSTAQARRGGQMAAGLGPEQTLQLCSGAWWPDSAPGRYSSEKQPDKLDVPKRYTETEGTRIQWGSTFNDSSPCVRCFSRHT